MVHASSFDSVNFFVTEFATVDCLKANLRFHNFHMNTVSRRFLLGPMKACTKGTLPPTFMVTVSSTLYYRRGPYLCTYNLHQLLNLNKCSVSALLITELSQTLTTGMIRISTKGAASLNSTEHALWHPRAISHIGLLEHWGRHALIVVK